MSVSIDIQKLRPAIAEFDFNKYKEKLSELNVLQKGKFPRGESNGLFDDKLWVTIRDNHFGEPGCKTKKNLIHFNF